MQFRFVFLQAMLQDRARFCVAAKNCSRLNLYSFHIIDPSRAAPDNHVTFTTWGDLSVSVTHLVPTHNASRGNNPKGEKCRSMTKFRNLIVAGILLLAGAPLFAQQITGSIRGTVSDSSGALVTGASVAARPVETGLTRTTTTEHSGNYLLLELPIGHYGLEVTAKGFQKYLQQGISLSVNETLTVSAHLAVGSETQQVQVKADAEMIQSTVSSLGQVV